MSGNRNGGYIMVFKKKSPEIINTREPIKEQAKQPELTEEQKKLQSIFDECRKLAVYSSADTQNMTAPLVQAEQLNLLYAIWFELYQLRLDIRVLNEGGK